MQPSRHKAQSAFVRAARVVAAFALVLALLSGIAPAGSLTSASESVCSMSCCIGLPPHKAGECAGVSCHVALRQKASHDTHDAAHDAHGEPHHDRHNAAAAHEVDAAAVHQHESHLQTTATHDAAHASHDAHAEETHHAEDHQASQSSETTNAGHASSSSKSKREERRANVAPASLANPCPSDCGMAAGSSAGNKVRPRDAATLTAALRLRPPARPADSKRSSRIPLASAGKHRLTPPRAPPLAL